MNGPQLRNSVFIAVAATLALVNGVSAAAHSSGSVAFTGQVVESACSLEVDNGIPAASIGQAISVGIKTCRFQTGGAPRATVAVTTSATAEGLIAIDDSLVELSSGGRAVTFDQNRRSAATVTSSLGTEDYIVQLGSRVVGKTTPTTKLAQSRINLEVTYK